MESRRRRMKSHCENWPTNTSRLVKGQIPFMFSVSQSQTILQCGGKDIRMDCFLPESEVPSEAQRFPAVIGLHGSGGGHMSMAEPATMLARQGFAVYVLHYFDRTGDERVNDKATILRNSPAWLKTIWEALNFVEKQSQVDAKRIGLLGFSLELTLRSPWQHSTAAWGRWWNSLEAFPKRSSCSCGGF